MNIDWRVTLRDVFLVLILVFAGQYLLSALLGPESGALGVGRIVFAAIGFCISACLNAEHRFKHLPLVAAGVWFFALIRMLVGGDVNLGLWVALLPSVFGAMLLGGAVSLAIVRPAASDDSQA